MVDSGEMLLIKLSRLFSIYEVLADSLPLHPQEVLISEVSVVFLHMYVPVTREIIGWVIVSDITGSPVAPFS